MFKKLIVNNIFENIVLILFLFYLKNWHRKSNSVIFINLKTEILIQNKTDLLIAKKLFL